MSHLFFDLDGTLTDPREGITGSILYALEALGAACPARAELEAQIGPPLRDAFRLLLPAPSEQDIEEAVRLYRVRFADRGLFENQVYEGIPEALESLRAGGCVLRVVTSKPHVYAERILEHFDLRAFFEGVVGAELDGRNSEKSKLVAIALREAEADPRATVMLGDRKHDLLGAQANGVRAWGVAWGFGSREELLRCEPERVLESVSDLAASRPFPLP